MHLEPESDLHWTAFLYVAGDLSPDEASSFELRLADDQDAREAVAGVVELAEALAIVGPEFPQRRRSIGRRALYSALAAAACLFLAVSARFFATSHDRPDASEVALAWSSLRAVADVESPASPTGLPVGVSTDVVPEIEPEVESPVDRALPSWLLSAASAAPGETPREED